MQIKFHTSCFNQLLWDVKEEDSSFRVHTFANDLRWIAGHLLSRRAHFAAEFGLSASFKGMSLFLDTTKTPVLNIPYDPSTSYPAMADIVKAWNSTAPELEAVLEQIPEEEASMILPFSVPTGGNTLLHILSYMASHESYHLGQMSVIRGVLGLPAMRFAPPG